MNKGKCEGCGRARTLIVLHPKLCRDCTYRKAADAQTEFNAMLLAIINDWRRKL